MQPMMRLLRKMRPALLRAADLIVMKMKAIRQRMIAMMKAVMKKMGPLRKKYLAAGAHGRNLAHGIES